MKLEADHTAVFEIGSGVLGRRVAEVASTEGAIEYVRLKNVAPAGKRSFETPTSLDWYWFNPEVGPPWQIAEVRNRNDKRFGRNLLPFTQLKGYCGSEATKMPEGMQC